MEALIFAAVLAVMCGTLAIEAAVLCVMVRQLRHAPEQPEPKQPAEEETPEAAEARRQAEAAEKDFYDGLSSLLSYTGDIGGDDD